jgi:hypothetical protein
MNLLLASERIQWRWVWLVVLLLLPTHFFLRHSYVRAICPSMIFMLLIVFFMFRQRFILAGLAVGLYTHLYLGAVVYSPVIVGAYVFSSLIGARGDRRFLWRLVLWTTLGWLAGLRTYPYFDGALEFLWMQIFGTGLNPDIAVGGEWNSYGNVWEFAVKMCGPLLAVWTLAIVLRTRVKTPITPKESTLLILSFGFLFLTLKAQRFIEYWPVFCLLSAAFLAAPLLNRLALYIDPLSNRYTGLKSSMGRALLAVLLAGAAVFAVSRVPISSSVEDPFVAEWRIWTLLLAAGACIAISRVWFQARLPNTGAGRKDAASPSESGRQSIAFAIPIILFGVASASAVSMLLRHLIGSGSREAQLSAGVTGILLAIAFAVVLVIVSWRNSVAAGLGSFGKKILDTATVGAWTVALTAVIVLLASPRLSAVQRDVYCGYNLPAMRDALAFIEQDSQPGDVVFTDDWDVFPAYFYHNSKNHYIVGLDPKFTHSRRPDLWERYIRITRGQIPREFTASWTGDRGERVELPMRVELGDIRDYFQARYVITDSEHKMLARKLAEAKEFAELVYPLTDYSLCQNEPFLVFRIRSENRTPDEHSEITDASSQSVSWLSDLTPVSVEQEWGELTINRSVSGKPLRLGERYFENGFGSHANSVLIFDVPIGAETFETLVGVNAFAEGAASIQVVIELDGKEVFRSDVIRVTDGPVAINLPVADAAKITLRAEPTDDGNQWDHVDWVKPRFHMVASPSSEP